MQVLTDYMNPSRQEKLSTNPYHIKQVQAYMILSRLIPQSIAQLDKEEIMRSINSLAVAAISIKKNVRREKLYNVFNFIVINILQRLQIELSTLEYIDMLVAAACFEYEFGDRVQIILDFIKPHFFELPVDVQGKIFWCLRRLRYYDEHFMLQVEAAILNGSLKLDCEGISKVLIVFSSLGLSDYSVLDTLVQQYLQVYEQVPNRAAGVIYNLAQLKYDQHKLQNLIDQTVLQYNPKLIRSFTPDFLIQIRKAQLYYEYEGMRLEFPRQLVISSRTLLRSYVQDSLIAKNEVAMELAKKLKRQFPEGDVLQRQAIMDGEMKTDVLLTCNGKAVSVEIRGKKSFTISQPQKLMGATRAQLEMLQNAGWNVVFVDERLWGEDKPLIYKKQIINQIYKIIYNEGKLYSNVSDLNDQHNTMLQQQNRKSQIKVFSKSIIGRNYELRDDRPIQSVDFIDELQEDKDISLV
eukprot:TRINITY_DN10935_c1_g1_i2.p1 TRINITY_DN10935_c1_g1~~TRINITY_DN10935_c1_g1_i2.p1  ORF type:complete len:482 (+),score=56.69 TRINITY_DN10935_c1_g1_i2:54-1448(+)